MVDTINIQEVVQEKLEWMIFILSTWVAMVGTSKATLTGKYILCCWLTLNKVEILSGRI